MNARDTALAVLIACRRDGAWADGALKQQLARDRLDRRDAALATRLVYGVLQNRLLLDHWLAPFLRGKLRRRGAGIFFPPLNRSCKPAARFFAPWIHSRCAMSGQILIHFANEFLRIADDRQVAAYICFPEFIFVEFVHDRICFPRPVLIVKTGLKETHTASDRQKNIASCHCQIARTGSCHACPARIIREILLDKIQAGHSRKYRNPEQFRQFPEFRSSESGSHTRPSEKNRPFRILQPAVEKDYWWKKAGMNWNPWICSNWLACVLICEKDEARKAEAIRQIRQSTQIFIDSYPEDGGCDEGAGYWDRAAASMFEVLRLLPDFSGDREKIRRMASADAHENKAIQQVNIVYPFGLFLGDKTMCEFGAYLGRQKHVLEHPAVLYDKSGNFPTLSRELFFLRHIRAFIAEEPREPLLKDVWLGNLQIMTARRGPLYVAMKGGHNNERNTPPRPSATSATPSGPCSRAITTCPRSTAPTSETAESMPPKSSAIRRAV